MRFARRPTKTERAKQATNSLYRSYFRTLYLSRLAWVAFWACFVYFLIWSVPLFGVGLSLDDYTPQFSVTIGFVGICTGLGMMTRMLRRTAYRKREALVAWSSLYDEAIGTHTRSHLYDRLSLECERSERRGRPFFLLLLKLRLPGAGPSGKGRRNGDFFRDAAERVQSLIRSSDLVALVSNDEFGVLLCGVSADDAALLAGRLRDSLEGTAPAAAGDKGLPDGTTVDVGMAMYGNDGRTPEALVEAARSSIALSDDDVPLARKQVA